MAEAGTVVVVVASGSPPAWSSPPEQAVTVDPRHATKRSAAFTQRVMPGASRATKRNVARGMSTRRHAGHVAHDAVERAVLEAANQAIPPVVADGGADRDPELLAGERRGADLAVDGRRADGPQGLGGGLVAAAVVPRGHVEGHDRGRLRDRGVGPVLGQLGQAHDPQGGEPGEGEDAEGLHAGLPTGPRSRSRGWCSAVTKPWAGSSRPSRRAARPRSAIGLMVVRATRSTSQARPDMSTPAPISTGTNTFMCSGRDSHAKPTRAGGWAAWMRSWRSTAAGVGRDGAAAWSSSRWLITLSRWERSDPITATSAAMKMAADMSARFHSHRYR